MPATYRLLRSDGQIIEGGGYAADTKSIVLVDLPPAGNWSYALQVADLGGPGTAICNFASLIAIVVKR